MVCLEGNRYRLADTTKAMAVGEKYPLPFFALNSNCECCYCYNICRMEWYGIIAIIGFVIGVLNWFEIKPRRLVQYFLEHKTAISYWTYLIIVSILTLYCIFIFIYLPLLGVFNTELALILTVTAFFVLGMWLPILQKQKYWRASLERIILLIGRLMAVGILVGYWFISWPDYLVPLILTSILIIVIFVHFGKKLFST